MGNEHSITRAAEEAGLDDDMIFGTGPQQFTVAYEAQDLHTDYLHPTPDTPVTIIPARNAAALSPLTGAEERILSAKLEGETKTLTSPSTPEPVPLGGAASAPPTPASTSRRKFWPSRRTESEKWSTSSTSAESAAPATPGDTLDSFPLIDTPASMVALVSAVPTPKSTTDFVASIPVHADGPPPPPAATTTRGGANQDAATAYVEEGTTLPLRAASLGINLAIHSYPFDDEVSDDDEDVLLQQEQMDLFSRMLDTISCGLGGPRSQCTPRVVTAPDIMRTVYLGQGYTEAQKEQTKEQFEMLLEIWKERCERLREDNHTLRREARVTEAKLQEMETSIDYILGGIRTARGQAQLQQHDLMADLTEANSFLKGQLSTPLLQTQIVEGGAARHLQNSELELEFDGEAEVVTMTALPFQTQKDLRESMDRRRAVL